MPTTLTTPTMPTTLIQTPTLASRPRRAIGALVAALAFALLPAATHAQDLTPKAPPQRAPALVKDATIHPIDALTIDRGFILYDKGVIIALGASDQLAPALASRGLDAATIDTIDAAGLHAYPGFIAAWTQLGLTEIAAVAATRDVEELGPITPEASPAIAINPDSTLLPVTRSTGVLIAGVVPEGGGAIPGQVAAVRLEGWSPEEMTIAVAGWNASGIAVNWPLARVIRAWWMDQSEDEQRAAASRRLAAVTDAFDAAEAYALARAADPSTPIDLRWDALARVLRDPLAARAQADSGATTTPAPTTVARAHRLYLVANTVEQINAAVAFALARGARPVIVGGREAPLCAPLLIEHNVPVIVLGTHVMPLRDDSAYDEPFTLPARLHALGVACALANSDDTAHERNLPFAAATAVKFGMPREQALRAITINPAVVLGIDDRYGTLAPGKSATFILTKGDPLEVTTQLVASVLDGRRLSLRTKQTDLADKYRQRYIDSGDLAPPAPAAPGAPPGASTTP
jgi:imidazolonepropionase-like amidohydrolase